MKTSTLAQYCKFTFNVIHATINVYSGNEMHLIAKVTPKTFKGNLEKGFKGNLEQQLLLPQICPLYYGKTNTHETF